MKKRNAPKRFFFLFLVFTILAIGGMLYLFYLGQQNPDNVTDEWFPTVGRIFGGIIGAFFGVTMISGIAWIVRSARSNG